MRELLEGVRDAFMHLLFLTGEYFKMINADSRVTETYHALQMILSFDKKRSPVIVDDGKCMSQQLAQSGIFFCFVG